MSDFRRSATARLQILDTSESEWSARLSMIEGARRFLFLTTYYFGCDDLGAIMIQALIAAAGRGVRVVLVLDDFGQRLGERMSTPAERTRLAELLRSFAAAGGRVVRYAPKSRRQRWLGGGLHVKIQVSEAGVAIFGSSNIAHHSFRQWNEVSLLVEGELVAHLLREACAYAQIPEDDISALVSMLPPPDDLDATARMQYLREDPEQRTGALFPFGAIDNRLTAELVRLIDEARHTLYITSFFYKPVPALAEAVMRACARGVRVEIFHSHRDSLQATVLPWLSSTFQFDRIVASGGRIHENIRGEHSKIVLVDDRSIAIGSYNFEHAAHDRLIEAMIFADDPGLCADFGGFFDRLRRDPGNVRIAPDWLRALPRGMRVKRWLHRPLQRWF